MADDKKLGSVVQIDGVPYDVQAKTAETADKLVNKLNISVKKGNATPTTVASFDGSETKTASIEILTYEIKKNGSTVTLTGSDGSTSSFTDSSNTGDMAKSVYDTNNNGKIDVAENAEKLGGTAASDFAKKSDLFSKNYNDLTNKPTIPTDTNTTYNLNAPVSKTNGNVTIDLKAGGSGSGTDSVVKIVGSGTTTVTTDVNGVININSAGTGGGGNSDYAAKAGYADSAGTAASAEYSEYANHVKVNMDNSTPYAVITISSEEPSEGKAGDIWFKY